MVPTQAASPSRQQHPGRPSSPLRQPSAPPNSCHSLEHLGRPREHHLGFPLLRLPPLQTPPLHCSSATLLLAHAGLLSHLPGHRHVPLFGTPSPAPPLLLQDAHCAHCLHTKTPGLTLNFLPALQSPPAFIALCVQFLANLPAPSHQVCLVHRARWLRGAGGRLLAPKPWTRLRDTHLPISSPVRWLPPSPQTSLQVALRAGPPSLLLCREHGGRQTGL